MTIVASQIVGEAVVDVRGGSFSFDSLNNPTTVGYRFGTLSEQRVNNGVASPPLNEWRRKGAAGDYEVRMTMVSGTTFSGAALGTWLDAAAGPYTWSESDSTTVGGPVEGTGLVEVRSKATGGVIDSASVFLSAERTT